MYELLNLKINKKRNKRIEISEVCKNYRLSLIKIIAVSVKRSFFELGS